MSSPFIFTEEQTARVEQKLRAALEEELDDLYDADIVVGESMLEQSAATGPDESGYNIQFTANYNTVDADDDVAGADEEE